jgi:hypothetical protein
LRVLQPLLFLVAALLLVDRDAVGLERAADEEALAGKPEVLALVAEEPEDREGGDLQRFLLAERVLLQLLPVVVPVVSTSDIRDRDPTGADGIGNEGRGRARGGEEGARDSHAPGGRRWLLCITHPAPTGCKENLGISLGLSRIFPVY